MLKHRLLQTKAGACSYFVDFYAGSGWTVRGPPSTVYKAGELHRKHSLLRTWRKHFVVLDQFSMRYFEDQQSFVAGKKALGTIPINGTVVFDGGNSATMGSPQIHVVVDQKHDQLFDRRLTCFSHPNKITAISWMLALQNLMSKRSSISKPPPNYEGPAPAARATSLSSPPGLDSAAKAHRYAREGSLSGSNEAPGEKLGKMILNGRNSSRWLEKIMPEEPLLFSDDVETLPREYKSQVMRLVESQRKNVRRRNKLSEVQAPTNWVLLCNVDGIKVYESERTGSKPAFQIVCAVPASPQAIAAIIDDPKTRPAWDIDFPIANIVDDVGPSTKILHLHGEIKWDGVSDGAACGDGTFRDVVAQALKSRSIKIRKRGLAASEAFLVCIFFVLITPVVFREVVALSPFRNDYASSLEPLVLHIVGAVLGGTIIGVCSNFYLVWGGFSGPLQIVRRLEDLFGGSDICVLRHTEIDSVGNITIAEESIDSVRCPKMGDCVRAKDHGGGFFISPVSKGQWPVSQVTYVVNTDFGGSANLPELNVARQIKRIKVILALRELVRQTVQSETYRESPTWDASGQILRPLYILERPMGDCENASRSPLINCVGFQRYWNRATHRSCWLPSPLNFEAQTVSKFKPCLWKPLSRSGTENTRNSADEVDGLASSPRFQAWDPEEWMRGMTRVPTGGLKGIQHEKLDSSRKKAHGTRRLLVDVLSDLIQHRRYQMR